MTPPNELAVRIAEEIASFAFDEDTRTLPTGKLASLLDRHLAPLLEALNAAQTELGENSRELAAVLAEDAAEMATPSLRINHRLNSVNATLRLLRAARAGRTG